MTAENNSSDEDGSTDFGKIPQEELNAIRAMIHKGACLAKGQDQALGMTLMEKVQTMVDHLETQQQEVNDLHRRLDQIEEVVNPDPQRREYDQMTKGDKVRAIRKALIRMAVDSNGKSAMKYDQVQALFDGHPSAPYAYDLMQATAQKDGFRYDEPDTDSNGQKRILCNIQSVNDSTLVNSVKNATDETPA